MGYFDYEQPTAEEIRESERRSERAGSILAVVLLTSIGFFYLFYSTLKYGNQRMRQEVREHFLKRDRSQATQPITYTAPVQITLEEQLVQDRNKFYLETIFKEHFAYFTYNLEKIVSENTTPYVAVELKALKAKEDFGYGKIPKYDTRRAYTYNYSAEDYGFSSIEELYEAIKRNFEKAKGWHREDLLLKDLLEQKPKELEFWISMQKTDLVNHAPTGNYFYRIETIKDETYVGQEVYFVRLWLSTTLHDERNIFPQRHHSTMKDYYPLKYGYENTEEFQNLIKDILQQIGVQQLQERR